jgi:hypothetical protein
VAQAAECLLCKPQPNPTNQSVNEKNDEKGFGLSNQKMEKTLLFVFVFFCSTGV